MFLTRHSKENAHFVFTFQSFILKVVKIKFIRKHFYHKNKSSYMSNSVAWWFSFPDPMSWSRGDDLVPPFLFERNPLLSILSPTGPGPGLPSFSLRADPRSVLLRKALLSHRKHRETESLSFAPAGDKQLAAQDTSPSSGSGGVCQRQS